MDGHKLNIFFSINADGAKFIKKLYLTGFISTAVHSTNW